MEPPVPLGSVILRGVSQKPLWDVPVHHVLGLGSGLHAAELHHLYYAVTLRSANWSCRSFHGAPCCTRALTVKPNASTVPPRRALSASSSSSSSSSVALRTRLVRRWGMQCTYKGHTMYILHVRSELTGGEEDRHDAMRSIVVLTACAAVSTALYTDIKFKPGHGPQHLTCVDRQRERSRRARPLFLLHTVRKRSGWSCGICFRLQA